MSYYVGDVWEAEDILTDPRTKALVDPTELLFIASRPDGSSEPYGVTRLGPGQYVARVALTQAGRWDGTFTSPSGAYRGVGKTSILVMP